MLNMVLENYIKLETSWNHNELKKVREKLTKTMAEFMDTMNVIMEILPQDVDFRIPIFAHGEKLLVVVGAEFSEPFGEKFP